MADLICLNCQIDIPATNCVGDRDRHLQRASSCIEAILQQQKIDLVVLPELCSIDYSREAFSQLRHLAEREDGESFRVWSKLAKKYSVAIVFGFAAVIDGGFTIATAVVGQGGELIAVYHKLHLAQFGDSMEKEYFRQGKRKLVIFEVNGFRVAPIICYDIRAPELCRTLSVEHGVDVILHTGAYARDASFYSWHAFAKTRALENQVFFVSLNRAGKHFGKSIVCPPWIDDNCLPVLLHDYEEEFRQIVLRRDEILRARSNYTFLQDRLESYDLPVVGRASKAGLGAGPEHSG